MDQAKLLTYDKSSSLECLANGLYATELLAQISVIPNIWSENTWRQDEAGGMSDTEAIMLRWAAANSFESVRDSVSCINTVNMDRLSAAKPLLERIVAAVGAIDIGRVFIVKLKPEGRIYPHSDVGIYADTFERFHLCLHAPLEFEFYSQHPTGPIQMCNMQAGELWWFNHKRVHWAYNGGVTDRISMIFDAVAPKFRKEREFLARGIDKVGMM